MDAAAPQWVPINKLAPRDPNRSKSIRNYWKSYISVMIGEYNVNNGYDWKNIAIVLQKAKNRKRRRLARLGAGMVRNHRIYIFICFPIEIEEKLIDYA